MHFISGLPLHHVALAIAEHLLPRLHIPHWSSLSATRMYQFQQYLNCYSIAFTMNDNSPNDPAMWRYSVNHCDDFWVQLLNFSELENEGTVSPPSNMEP